MKERGGEGRRGEKEGRGQGKDGQCVHTLFETCSRPVTPEALWQLWRSPYQSEIFMGDAIPIISVYLLGNSQHKIIILPAVMVKWK